MMIPQAPLPFLVAGLYFLALLVVGLCSGRRKRDSNQYLNATRSLPLWVSAGACVAANCGSLEVFAMAALGAQYGLIACNFYWAGAIPALLVVAFWLLPAYARGQHPTVLDFVEHCHGRPARTLAALAMAAMMMLLAGVCLSAVAQVLGSLLGWPLWMGIVVTAPLVLLYTWSGGFRATVYTELLHFGVVLAAIVPLFVIMARSFGGVGGWLQALPRERLHTWASLPWMNPAAQLDRFGLFFGLVLVLSLGFWGTDFVQMQRALAVRRAEDVPAVPLSIATAKLVFAFVLVLPGVTAPLVLGHGLQGNWNATLPMLMAHYYSPLGMAVGMMGIMASLVSTFANNVAGFNSVWIQSLYQPLIRPNATDEHYLWASRWGNAAAVVLSIGSAFLALNSNSLMEYIQMILALTNAPIFALVLLGALVPRRACGGGLSGMAAGLAAAGLHQGLVLVGWLHYGSRMSNNFYAAALSFSVTATTILLVSAWRLKTANTPPTEALNTVQLPHFTRPKLLWAAALAAAFVALSVRFW